MSNREALRQELKQINEILEDHAWQRKLDSAFGYEPRMEEEEEYLHELCLRKMEIGHLLKTGQEE